MHVTAYLLLAMATRCFSTSRKAVEWHSVETMRPGITKCSAVLACPRLVVYNIGIVWSYDAAVKLCIPIFGANK